MKCGLDGWLEVSCLPANANKNVPLMHLNVQRYSLHFCMKTCKEQLHERIIFHNQVWTECEKAEREAKSWFRPLDAEAQINMPGSPCREVLSPDVVWIQAKRVPNTTCSSLKFDDADQEWRDGFQSVVCSHYPNTDTRHVLILYGDDNEEKKARAGC